jgi:hypothetical protein
LQHSPNDEASGGTFQYIPHNYKDLNSKYFQNLLQAQSPESQSNKIAAEKSPGSPEEDGLLANYHKKDQTAVHFNSGACEVENLGPVGQITVNYEQRIITETPDGWNIPGRLETISDEYPYAQTGGSSCDQEHFNIENCQTGTVESNAVPIMIENYSDFPTVRKQSGGESDPDRTDQLKSLFSTHFKNSSEDNRKG